MICSGKSTYASNAAKKGLIICNDDSIVNLLHGNHYTLFNKKLKILYKSIENHILTMSLGMGLSVLVDRGLCVSAKGRRRWLSLAKSFDVPCEAIVFPNEGPEVHAKRRFEQDNRGHTYEYWLKTAQAHYDNYMVPSWEEDFAKVHFITWQEIKKGRVI